VASKEMLERMQRFQERMSAKRSGFMSLGVGQHIIRVLPSWRGDDEDWYLYLPTHYRVGPTPEIDKTGTVVTCLQFFGEKCPVEQYARKLLNSVDEHGEPIEKDVAKGQAFLKNSQDKVIMNVLPNNDAHGTICSLSVKYKPTFIEMQQLMLTSGDFFDPDEGYQLCITGTPAERGTYRWVEYKVTAVGRGTDKIAKASWREELPNLDMFAEKCHRSREEIIALLQGKKQEKV